MICQTGVYWDRVAEHWTQSRPHRLWRAHSDAVNTALLQRWLENKKVNRLLKTDLFDETCGDGLYPFLLSRTHAFHGIDLAYTAAHAAMDRFPRLRGMAADVRRLPFADQTFDAIVSTSTLDHFEHASQILTAIQELSRVLKKGGELILTLDNGGNPLVALRNALPFGLLKWTHLTPYYVGATCDLKHLRRLLAQAGLRELQATAILHCPRVLAVAAARLMDRLGSPRWQARCLSILMKFERLSHWRGRFLSGYFIAVKCRKI